MNALALVAYISFFLIALLAAGIIAVLIGSIIWHYAPNSRISRWISYEVIQEVDVIDIKIGGCISPKTHMIGGAECDE